MDDSRELIQKRLMEATEQLGKYEADDKEHRSAKMSEITNLTNSLVALDKVENERLNNNARNSVDEERLVIDAEKIEVEKKKIRFGKWQLGIGIVGGFLIQLAGFILNENMQKEGGMTRFAEKCAEDVRKIKIP